MDYRIFKCEVCGVDWPSHEKESPDCKRTPPPSVAKVDQQVAAPFLRNVDKESKTVVTKVESNSFEVKRLEEVFQ